MARRSKGKVLVVDDDPIVLEVVRERLTDAGYDVVVRDRPIGTSQSIVEHAPDVLLLDVMMPGLSGEHLASLLRRNERTRKVAIVLHSSKTESELRPLIRQTEAVGAIQKTDDRRAFLDQFERVMGLIRG